LRKKSCATPRAGTRWTIIGFEFSSEGIGIELTPLWTAEQPKTSSAFTQSTADDGSIVLNLSGGGAITLAGVTTLQVGFVV
jgi:hypothetical protein